MEAAVTKTISKRVFCGECRNGPPESCGYQGSTKANYLDMDGYASCDHNTPMDRLEEIKSLLDADLSALPGGIGVDMRDDIRWLVAEVEKLRKENKALHHLLEHDCIDCQHNDELDGTEDEAICESCRDYSNFLAIEEPDEEFST